MKVWVQRIANGLYVPDGSVYDDFRALFDTLPWRKPYKAELTQPRNIEHHKLYWALCTRIGNGIGRDAEWVSDAFKVETGHYNIYTTRGGRDVLQLKSISFDKMDQLAFSEFFENCVAVAYQQWHIDPASIADLLLPPGLDR